MMTAEERINEQGWSIMTSNVQYKIGHTLGSFVQANAGDRVIPQSIVITRQVTRDEYTAEMIAMGGKPDQILYWDYFYEIRTD